MDSGKEVYMAVSVYLVLLMFGRKTGITRQSNQMEAAGPCDRDRLFILGQLQISAHARLRIVMDARMLCARPKTGS